MNLLDLNTQIIMYSYLIFFTWYFHQWVSEWLRLDSVTKGAFRVSFVGAFVRCKHHTVLPNEITDILNSFHLLWKIAPSWDGAGCVVTPDTIWQFEVGMQNVVDWKLFKSWNELFIIMLHTCPRHYFYTSILCTSNVPVMIMQKVNTFCE